MKALSYLFLTTLKNRIKQLKNNPGQLVLVLLFIGMLVLVIFSSSLSPEAERSFRPKAELGALILALYAIMFVMVCTNGLASGASFYAMADVNLLFATPIRQQRILFYGLVRQLGTSMLLGLFILFQFSWMHQTYNVSFPGLLAIFFGYCLTVFCAQFTSMVVYSFTSGSESRRRTVKMILLLLSVAAIAAVGIPVLRVWQTPDARLGAAADAGNSPLLALFPVAGWLKAAVVGALEGAYLPIFLGLCAAAVYVVALVVVIMKTHADFYEDVLKATEVSFTAITAAKQGKMREALPANVKVGKTGINGGKGPEVFFYKHRLESRRSRVFLLDTAALIFAAISIGFAFFMRGEGILPAFGFATYMQLFSTSTGRWLRELLLPYAYLIPASPFRKLLAVCHESIYKAAVESVVVILPIGLVVSATPLEITVCVLARFSFALLFMAGNIIVERLFGQIVNKGLILVVFILSMLILAAPGIIVGAILGFVYGTAAAMLVITVWNGGAAALATFLCRDILNYAELNNR